MNEDSLAHFERRARVYEVIYGRRRHMLWLFLIVFISFPIVFAVLSLVPPFQGILTRQEQLLAAQLEGMKRIPDIEKQLKKLESQLAILSTESIDNRLRQVETAIHAGNIKPDEISAFMDVKKDVDVLKSYMFQDPKELVEFKELQKNYARLAESESQYATKDSLRAEIGTLQTFINFVLTFFGILFTVLFGSWWFIGRKSQEGERPTRPIHRPAPSTDNAQD